MDTGELVDRRVTRLERHERVVDAGGADALGDGREAGRRARGVPGPDRVLRRRRRCRGPAHAASVPAQSETHLLRVRSDAVAERITGGRTRHHSFGWARAMPWRGHDDIAHLVMGEQVPTDTTVVETACDRSSGPDTARS